MTAAFTTADVIAPAWFVACWLGYGMFADRSRRHDQPGVGGGLMARMHAYRLIWMRRMLERDNRILDSQIIGTLMGSVSFFASTTIFLIAGLIAGFGAREQALALLRELPFAVDTSPLLWDLKLLLLVVLFIYAFFKFTWALRHFNYCAIVVGCAPPYDRLDGRALRVAERAARMATSAARHFNAGVRAYYFGLAALSWFIQPWLFVALTTWVVLVLYRREFRSNLLRTLGAAEELEAGVEEEEEPAQSLV